MFKSVLNCLVTFIGKIHWPAKNIVPLASKDIISKMMVTDYYIILTRRDNHLSTYAQALAHVFLTGKFGYYSHALMNLEGDDVTTNDDFRIVEATGVGVHYSTFDEVFGDCSSAVLLKPKRMTIEDWTIALDKAKTELGKPYDTLLDLYNDNALNCSELVRIALMATPDYLTNFPGFDKMVKMNPMKNLDPQMIYECDDFEVAYEVRAS